MKIEKKIGIIGCGLIGWKRAKALKKKEILGELRARLQKMLISFPKIK